MSIQVTRRPKQGIKPVSPFAKPINITADGVLAFWAKVEKGDGCWEWTGSKNGADGYGKFRSHIASRYSFALHYFDPPADIEVCHTCDNPACVRPDHLVLGTHRENGADMVNKGRAREASEFVAPHCREDSTDQILAMGRAGVGLFEIAKQLRLPVALVRRVRNEHPQSEGGTATYQGKKPRFGHQKWGSVLR